MNWSYVQSHFYLASKERLYDLWGRDSELVRDSKKQRQWEGTRTKNRGFFRSKVLYSGKHCALRPEFRIKTQLC